MTQDAGALLKLADELKWRSNDLDYDAVDQKIFASTEKFIRQAASQGSAVGERSEVQINYALRGEIADAIREYCHSVSPAAVQNSHGVERIYYSGISLDGLTDAVFAILGVAQASPDYSAWLIEMPERFGPLYFHFEHDDDWTKDHDKACHFARKEDAEKVIEHYGWTRAVAVEHMWPGLGLDGKPQDVTDPLEPTAGASSVPSAHREAGK